MPKKIDWSSLWKKEEWLAVWLGFLIIIVLLAGLQFKPPAMRWTTDGEFVGFLADHSPMLGKVIKDAEAKGEDKLKETALALKAAIEKKDRKAIGEAAKKLADGAKGVKDGGLKKNASKLGGDIRRQAGNLPGKVFSWNNIQSIIYLGIAYLILSTIAIAFMGGGTGRFIAGFPLVFIFAWIAQFLAGNYTILEYGLEYVLWCLIIGLLISNTFGIPDWLRPAVRTEFYIKTGLVILGSRVLFGEIVQAGGYGIVQALLVVGAVWYLTFWIAQKLRVDDDFAAILSSGVSICGVSAAIATAGAIKGDPKKLSYVTSIVLVCAVPMMVLMPLIAKTTGMSDVVAGAWLGGTLDTSGSVVAAGALISESAMKTGVIVKMSQNVLIGFAAFILAVVWAFREKAQMTGEKPSAMEIWFRFPKFVLGFMAASLLFSFFLEQKTIDMVKGPLGSLQTWWFAMAFTSIGLETRFLDLAKLGGGRPALAFLMGQGFNIIWTLILAYLLFGGILFPAPKL